MLRAGGQRGQTLQARELDLVRFPRLVGSCVAGVSRSSISLIRIWNSLSPKSPQKSGQDPSAEGLDRLSAGMSSVRVYLANHRTNSDCVHVGPESPPSHRRKEFGSVSFRHSLTNCRTAFVGLVSRSKADMVLQLSPISSSGFSKFQEPFQRA